MVSVLLRHLARSSKGQSKYSSNDQIGTTLIMPSIGRSKACISVMKTSVPTENFSYPLVSLYFGIELNQFTFRIEGERFVNVRLDCRVYMKIPRNFVLRLSVVFQHKEDDVEVPGEAD